MKSTKQARRDAKHLFRLCLVDGILDAQRVRQTVQLLIQSRPRGYMGILSGFHRRVKHEIDRRAARVESAITLSSDLQSSVQADLGRVYGPGLAVAFAENASLIGGMRVQVGSDVYDGSVRARLASLEQSF